MTNQSIGIELRETREFFVPGDILRGRLCWNSEFQPSTIELRLGWYVEGKDYRDVMSHAKNVYKMDRLVGIQDFEIALPIGPYSYTGKLFSLRWIIEASSKKLGLCTQVQILLKAPNF